MTIEEKARAYDEAKARMSKAYNDNRCSLYFMNEIFPESKESEYEKIRKNIIELVKQAEQHIHGDGVYSKEIAWLKSLKDRVQPQPQKEWSEVDETNLTQLYKLIVEKAYREYEIDTDDETLYGKWLKLDNWLKSFKGRVQPQWKPSEEQIKDFGGALLILKLQHYASSESLVSLYEQLKKL